ncbi:MAG: hypothetical protein WA057_00265 [Candidatus Magasanikiibacteriota bacterium]
MEDKKIYKAQINITGGKGSSGVYLLFYIVVFFVMPFVAIQAMPDTDFSSIKSLVWLGVGILGFLLIVFVALSKGGYRDVWFEGSNLAVKNKKDEIKYYPITNSVKLKGWKTKAFVKDMGEMFEYTFIIIFSTFKGFTIEPKSEKEFDALISVVSKNIGRQIEVVEKIDKYFKVQN